MTPEEYRQMRTRIRLMFGWSLIFGRVRPGHYFIDLIRRRQ